MSGNGKGMISANGVNWSMINSYIQEEIKGLDSYEIPKCRSQQVVSPPIQVEEYPSKEHSGRFKFASAVSNKSPDAKQPITEFFYVEEAMTDLHRLFRQELDDLTNSFDHRLSSVLRIERESKQDNHKKYIRDNSRMETIERKVEIQSDTIERNSAFISHQQNWMNEANKMLDQSNKSVSQFNQHLLINNRSMNNSIFESRISNIENVQKIISDGLEKAKEQISILSEIDIRLINQTIHSQANKCINEATSSMMNDMQSMFEGIVEGKLAEHINDKIEMVTCNIKNDCSTQVAELCTRMSTFEKDLQRTRHDLTKSMETEAIESTIQNYIKHESNHLFADAKADIKKATLEIRDQIKSVETKSVQESAAAQENFNSLTTTHTSLETSMKEQFTDHMRETSKRIETCVKSRERSDMRSEEHEKKLNILDHGLAKIQRDNHDTCRKMYSLMETVSTLPIEQRLDAIEQRLADFQTEIQKLQASKQHQIGSEKITESALATKGHQLQGRTNGEIIADNSNCDRFNTDDDSSGSETDKMKLTMETSPMQIKSNVGRLKGDNLKRSLAPISTTSKIRALGPTTLRNRNDSRCISFEGPLNEDDCDIIEDVRTIPSSPLQLSVNQKNNLWP